MTWTTFTPVITFPHPPTFNVTRGRYKVKDGIAYVNVFFFATDAGGTNNVDIQTTLRLPVNKTAGSNGSMSVVFQDGSNHFSGNALHQGFAFSEVGCRKYDNTPIMTTGTIECAITGFYETDAADTV